MSTEQAKTFKITPEQKQAFKIPPELLNTFRIENAQEVQKMTIKELTPEQLTQVKQEYYTRKLEEQGQSISYLELATVNELVTDAEIFEAYAGTEFTPGDFE